jgi:polyamine oxidase
VTVAGDPEAISRRTFVLLGVAMGVTAGCSGDGGVTSSRSDAGTSAAPIDPSASSDPSAPPTLPRPTGVLRGTWERDPFSLGAYSYLPPGATGETRRALGAALLGGTGGVFFAGEATSVDHPSTVHGAFESGERAANEVIDAIAPESRVVIIGGGVAGLAAAAALRRSGFTHVVLLEARDRLGGRVDTVDTLGVPLDRGANWIHGIDGNPIRRLVDDAGRSFSVTDWESFSTFDADGQAIDAAVARAAELLDEVLAAVDESAEPDDDTSLAVAAEPLLQASISGDVAVDAVVRWLFSAITSGDYAADPEELSAASWDDDESYGGPDAVVDGGYRTVVDLLAANADGVEVRLGAIVTGVRRPVVDGQLATVDLVDGSSIDADVVVVTVPLAVLQSGAIRFDPSLPEATSDAIAQLGVGSFDKLFLRFEERFWGTGTTFFGYVDRDEPGRWGTWFDLTDVVGAPVLLVWHGGRDARELADLDDDAVVDRAMTVLERLFSPQ